MSRRGSLSSSSHLELRAEQHCRLRPLAVGRLRHHRLADRILRTVRRGEAFSSVPYVRPGGEVPLRVSGWPKVERVLQAIDAVEHIGIDAAVACPDHWRRVHNRLAAGEAPRPYSREQHRAWMVRTKINA